MKYKKGLIFICLIICLFSIASVCASDVNESVVASDNQNELITAEDNNEIITHDNQVNDENVSARSSNSVDEVDATDENELSATTGTFKDLYSEIFQAGNEINLTRDYCYSSGDTLYKDGITVDQVIVINGNGHYIDGKNTARAFNLDDIEGNHEITFINITFKNCSHKTGGAIFVSYYNLHIINCTFENNYAENMLGSDIYGQTTEFTLIGSKFSYNRNYWNVEGTINLKGKNFLISDCVFYNNSHIGDEALLLDGSNILINNCDFYTYGRINQAIIATGRNITISDCNFTNNSGGGICFRNVKDGKIQYCNFINNGKNSVMFEGTSSNCILFNSTFKNNKGPTISWDCRFGDIISCNFYNNGNYSYIFNGNETYCNIINNTGYGIPTKITIDKTELYYKDKFLIHLTDFDGNPVLSTKLKIDIGKYHYENVTFGIKYTYTPDYILIDISNIKDEGIYDANIYFEGSSEYECSSLHKTLTINFKRNSWISVSDKISYKPNILLSGKLYGENTKETSILRNQYVRLDYQNISLSQNLTFFCNNKYYTQSNNERISLNLNPGTYETIVYFDGDEIYSSSESKFNITILPSIILNNFKNEYESNINFNIKFLTGNGNVLNYHTVLFSIDGIDETLITSSEGIINYNKQLSVGSHTLKIVNTNTKEEVFKIIVIKEKINNPTQPANPSKIVNKISLTLKKVTVKRSAKKLVIQATLKINGKAVKNKWIKFKFNNKNYKAKTNAKGVAKITVKKAVLKKLKVGKKVKYQASYGKIIAKKTVKVKK